MRKPVGLSVAVVIRRPHALLASLLFLAACGDDPQGIPQRVPRANLQSSAVAGAPGWQVTLLASDVSTSFGGVEAITVVPTTGDLILRSLFDAGGCGVQFTRVSRTGEVTALATFPRLRNSNLTGLAYDPLTGGIIVEAEMPAVICSGNHGGGIALLDLGTLALGTLYSLPWTLNPVENGTGPQQYAPDLRNPTVLYFWDSSVSQLLRLDRATGALTAVYALDQGTPIGEHVSTAGNDVAFDPSTGRLILSDRSSNSVLEIDPATGTATPLFAGLSGPPRAVALDPTGAEVFVTIAGSIFLGPRAGGSLSLVATGFESPLDIAVGPATSGTGYSIFVASRTTNAVFEVTFVATNLAPIANPGGPYSGSEGGAIGFDGTGSTDPDADFLTYAWDFGDGTGATEVTPTHTYMDNGVFQVTLTVTDPEGLSSAVVTSATISNVSPTIGAIDGATVLQGEDYTSAGAFTDPGADAWAASVDYGDGSWVQPLTLVGSAFTLSHGYAAPGIYTVTVTINDDDGGVGIGQASVAVQSPQQAIGSLLTSIASLADVGALSPGNAQSLSATLKAARDRLDAGNPRAAANQLRAFINQAYALVSAGNLSVDQGQVLVNTVMRIIRATQLF